LVTLAFCLHSAAGACIIGWMSRLTLNLPVDVAAALAQESREANRGLEEFALDLLKRALAIRRFRTARKSIIEALRTDGPDSEDDIFEQIS
jgi:hypothetical protein